MQTTLAALAVVAVGYILAYLALRSAPRPLWVRRWGRVRADRLHPRPARHRAAGGGAGAGSHADRQPRARLAGHARWGPYFRLPTLALLPAESLANRLRRSGRPPSPRRSRRCSPCSTIVAGYGWPDAAVQAVTLAAIATLSSPAAVDAFADRARSARRSCPCSSSPPASTRLSRWWPSGWSSPFSTRARSRRTSVRRRLDRVGGHQPGGRGRQRGALPSLPGAAWRSRRRPGQQPALRRSGGGDRGGQRRQLLSQPLAASTPTWSSASSSRTAGARIGTSPGCCWPPSGRCISRC